LAPKVIKNIIGAVRKVRKARDTLPAMLARQAAHLIAPRTQGQDPPALQDEGAASGIAAGPEEAKKPREEVLDKSPRGPQRKKRKRRKSTRQTEQAPWDLTEFEVAPESGRMRFHDIELPEEVMHAIHDLGFEYCTPIQAAALPAALEGDDVYGRAQTGTGKSAAFLIAILTRLYRNSDRPRRKGTPKALVIAPTRELVMQIEQDAIDLGKYLPVNTVAVFGGMDYSKQEKTLRSKPVDILVATPGRLLDFNRRGVVRLNEVEILIIDEADRMLDMGFIPDVSSIIRATRPKDQRNTMLFSATLTPQVTRLANQWTRKPVHIEIEPEQVAVDTVDQKVYIVTDEEKFIALCNLIEKRNLGRVLVFCNRKDRTRRIADLLWEQGFEAAQMSGDVRQTTRVKTLERFRAGQLRILVATDVAARGIHVDSISHVVNFDLPENPEDYVHRIGRTGRAGERGTSVCFASETDAFYIEPIQDFIGRKLECTFPEEELLTPLPAPTRRRPRREREGGRGGRGDRGRGGRSGHGRGGRSGHGRRDDRGRGGRRR